MWPRDALFVGFVVAVVYAMRTTQRLVSTFWPGDLHISVSQPRFVRKRRCTGKNADFISCTSLRSHFDGLISTGAYAVAHLPLLIVFFIGRIVCGVRRPFYPLNFVAVVFYLFFCDAPTYCAFLSVWRVCGSIACICRTRVNVGASGKEHCHEWT